ncbi:aldolase [Pyrenochaeta sp. DS3sAY3a]|nr:aldolase [Pyrenochaeta sp. DS3sAY3a]
MPTQSQPSVRIFEVGPRDGLQNIKQSIPTPTKIELITRLRATGLRDIELTSAVSPRSIPQLADNQALLSHSSIQALLPLPDVNTAVLVPNVRGLEAALGRGVRCVAVFVSASEGFSRANIRCSVEEGVERARSVAERAKGVGVRVRGYISCIFEDPFDGPTPEAAVLDVVEKLLAMGCYEVSLGDTLGTGTAADVRRLLTYLFAHGIPASKLAGHFHDTYGQAVANAWEAYQLGIRTFDASVAGLGGCPFAPGARGNVASEDLVYLFERAGVSTGVDLGRLVETGAWISEQLKGRNESRAGAALARKHGLLTSPSSPSKKEAPKKESSKIHWTLLPTSSPGLQIHRAGPNIKLILDRPSNGNALTTDMITAMTSFFSSAATDKSISRIVITATGKFFCTGMDLSKSSSPVASSSSDASAAQFTRLTRLFEVIATAPQVTLAAVNGPAFGGGVGLAFACDIRIAAATAAFTLSEVKLGLAPATISPYVLREWGVPFAREAMLSGRAVGGGELSTRGVVARVLGEKEGLEDAVDGYLGRLRGAAPRASTLVKELVRVAGEGGNAGGSESPAERIRAVFDEMMAPGGEAAFGLKEFQAGRRSIDWDAYVLAKAREGKAKL